MSDLQAPKCTVCGSTRVDHIGRKHIFTLELNDLREAPTPQQEKVASGHPALSAQHIGTDIVLRLALINAGVITANDILDAEAQLGLCPRPEAGASDKPSDG